MKDFKEFFTKTKFGIGIAVGVAIGYFIEGESSGVIGAAVAITVIAIVAERMFFSKW